jgi:hypothetical protein
MSPERFLLLVAALASLTPAVGSNAARAPRSPAHAAARGSALPLPELDLVLRPHATGGRESYIGVRETLVRPGLASGATLVRMPLTIVGIPTARYDGNAITASDARGALALTTAEEPPTPQGIYRDWKVPRATVGDVLLTYRAPPRLVTAATNNGPLFDLREEAGGFAGAGIGFLALPARQGPYRIRLTWDLRDEPAGSRGEWSLGDGDVEVSAPAEALGFSYYAVGPLKSIPPRNDGKFGLYWLADPPFDVRLLGERIRSLHATMSGFFGDSTSSYRVFMRQNPYEGSGGSAFPGSFMFGYNPREKPTLDELQGLIAHEMTHNWPALEGEHGDTAWYSEGTAEYYSLLLSHRGGELSTGEFLAAINEKAAAYYTNPYLRLTNREAAKLFWTDPIAQTVPYGRGFLYLIITDAAIRSRSHGKRSLDEVVLELYRRKVQGRPYGIPEWLELIGREIGAPRARAAYERMIGGAVQIPPRTRFAPCLELTKQSTRAFQLGFARSSLNDARIVRELDPGSAAARAGIRDGDRIIDVAHLKEARSNDATRITLTLRRTGTDVAVSYLPRGKVLEKYSWIRNPAVAESACQF